MFVFYSLSLSLSFSFLTGFSFLLTVMDLKKKIIFLIIFLSEMNPSKFIQKKLSFFCLTHK
jgi:hypothetical protein